VACHRGGKRYANENIKTGYLIFGVAQDLINRKLKNGFLTDQNLTKRKHTSFTASWIVIYFTHIKNLWMNVSWKKNHIRIQYNSNLGRTGMVCGRQILPPTFFKHVKILQKKKLWYRQRTNLVNYWRDEQHNWRN
jgi:hypothetical protein